MRLLICVLFVALSACGPMGQPSAPAELRGRWDVQQIAGSPLGQGDRAYLDIDPNAMILRGWTGCRGISAPLTSFSGSLGVGAVTQSQGACPHRAALTDEARLLGVLPHVQRYILHGRRLELLQAANGSEALIILRRSDEAPQ